MKVTSFKEAEDWFAKNPGRSVTAEAGDNSVNVSNLEEAKLVFDKQKPAKEKATS